MAKRPSLYSLLGLLRSASVEDIRRAYLKAAKKLHPDKNIAAGDTELFLDIQQAYQILTDPQRRAAYDATLPAEEKGAAAPIQLSILTSREELPDIQSSQLVYVMLDISQSEEFKKETGTPPLNICLAIDSSTSMQGAKMDMVKATAGQLIRKLRPQDIFSVVSFNDRAEVILPATRQINAQRAISQIHMLQTKGGTEIFHGLEAAMEEVRRYGSPGSINHIILLTDGRTYGDEDKCYTLAKNAAEDGIGISGMGIGSGWNDVFLDHLSHSTGGNCMYVAQPQDIETLLNDKFAHLSRTVAENVSLYIKHGSDISISYSFRMQPEPSPLVIEAPLRLGPIFRDEHLQVIFEISVAGSQPHGKTIPIMNGHIEIASASLSSPLLSLPVQIHTTINRDADPQALPPAPIVQALSKLMLYRMQEKARLAVGEGNYEKATQHLQRMATKLLAQGERNLAKTILLEIDSLEKQQQFSESGDKNIKYGTRTLMMSGEKKP